MKALSPSFSEVEEFTPENKTRKGEIRFFQISNQFLESYSLEFHMVIQKWPFPRHL